jgi:hypothetical protein
MGCEAVTVAADEESSMHQGRRAVVYYDWVRICQEKSTYSRLKMRGIGVHGNLAWDVIH